MDLRLRREIWFEYSHARGAGGQHVNKAATRVCACFAIDNSALFSQQTKSLLRCRLHNRISKDGILRLTVEDSRSQSYNKEVAVKRLFELILTNLKIAKKRKKTAATYSSRLRRLAAKNKRSLLKESRKKIQL